MDAEALRASPIGQIVPIVGTDGRTGHRYSHFAYIPDPLPEAVALTGETLVRVEEAAAALGRLDMASTRLPNPGLIRRPTLRREAQSTSALEGTYAPFQDVLGADTEPERPTDPILREVLNYVRVAEAAFVDVVERPISMATLSSYQAELVAGTRGESADTGRLRERQVFIGPVGSPIEAARFVPSPPDDRLRAGCESWEAWLNAAHRELAHVVQTAMAHYQFEALHPFSDGNGRLGRLVIVLQLCRAGLLRGGFLAVSPWFEQRRREYQDQLFDLSRTGDWDAWVRFFSTGLRDSATTTCEQVDQLIAYEAELKQLVADHRWKGLVGRLAENLVGWPVLTVPWVERRFEVSFPTANNAVAKLVDAGVLHEATGGNYRRVFIARRVLDILS